MNNFHLKAIIHCEILNEHNIFSSMKIQVILTNLKIMLKRIHWISLFLFYIMSKWYVVRKVFVWHYHKSSALRKQSNSNSIFSSMKIQVILTNLKIMREMNAVQVLWLWRVLALIQSMVFIQVTKKLTTYQHSQKLVLICWIGTRFNFSSFAMFWLMKPEGGTYHKTRSLLPIKILIITFVKQMAMKMNFLMKTHDK